MMYRFTQSGLDDLLHDFELIGLPPNKRVALLRGLGKKNKQLIRKRIREQRDVNGNSFAPRKNRKVRKKLLSKVHRKLRVMVVGSNRVDIGTRNRVDGAILARHQYGGEEVLNKSDIIRMNIARQKEGGSGNEGMATRKQAKKLRELDYKVRRAKGKGWRSASLKEIQNTLSNRRAGIIISVLQSKQSNGGASKKNKWVIKVPARPFLGASQEEIKQMTRDILEQTIGR